MIPIAATAIANLLMISSRFWTIVVRVRTFARMAHGKRRLDGGQVFPPSLGTQSAGGKLDPNVTIANRFAVILEHERLRARRIRVTRGGHGDVQIDVPLH